MNWALIFFVASLIAGVLGFTSIAGDAAWIGKLAFFALLLLTLVALISAAHPSQGE